MVPVNDLRIGNWVNYNGTPTKIECIDIRGRINYPIPIEEKTNLIITESNIDSIPITREIVEFLGFTKTTGSNFKYELEIPGPWPFRDKLLARIDNKNFENWVSIKASVNDWEVCAASSLHQLQNLYFLIAGQEIIGPYCDIRKKGDTWVICRSNNGS